MANEMLTWARRQVFQQFDLSTSERLVLMLLADNASWDEEDGHWYAKPFQKTLARDAGMTERSVQRAVSKLADHGLLSKERRKLRAGALGGNGYVLHPERVDQPITLTRANRVTTRDDTVSGLDFARDDTVSPHPSDPRIGKTRHSVGSVENSDRPDTGVGSEATPVSGPAREVDARASLNHQVEPSSSSSISDEFSAAAGAAGDDDDDQWPSAEEDPRPDASAASSAVSATEAVAVSAADLPDQAKGSASDMSGELAGGADSGAATVSAVESGGVHRGVDVAVVANQLSATIGRRASTADIRWLIDQVLDRAKTRVQRPTPYVVASVTADPAGWAAQLSSIPTTASVELPGQGMAGQSGGHMSGQFTGQVAGQMSAAGRPGCPVDDHSSFGHRQGRCRMCRSEAMAGGWRAEYDAGRMARSKFDRLSAEAQQVVRTQGIEVTDEEEAERLQGEA